MPRPLAMARCGDATDYQRLISQPPPQHPPRPEAPLPAMAQQYYPNPLANRSVLSWRQPQPQSYFQPMAQPPTPSFPMLPAPPATAPAPMSFSDFCTNMNMTQPFPSANPNHIWDLKWSRPPAPIFPVMYNHGRPQESPVPPPLYNANLLSSMANHFGYPPVNPGTPNFSRPFQPISNPHQLLPPPLPPIPTPTQTGSMLTPLESMLHRQINEHPLLPDQSLLRRYWPAIYEATQNTGVLHHRPSFPVMPQAMHQPARYFNSAFTPRGLLMAPPSATTTTPRPQRPPAPPPPPSDVNISGANILAVSRQLKIPLNSAETASSSPPPAHQKKKRKLSVETTTSNPLDLSIGSCVSQEQHQNEPQSSSTALTDTEYTEQSQAARTLIKLKWNALNLQSQSSSSVPPPQAGATLVSPKVAIPLLASERNSTQPAVQLPNSLEILNSALQTIQNISNDSSLSLTAKSPVLSRDILQGLALTSPSSTTPLPGASFFPFPPSSSSSAKQAPIKLIAHCHCEKCNKRHGRLIPNIKQLTFEPSSSSAVKYICSHENCGKQINGFNGIDSHVRTHIKASKNMEMTTSSSSSRAKRSQTGEVKRCAVVDVPEILKRRLLEGPTSGGGPLEVSSRPFVLTSSKALTGTFSSGNTHAFEESNSALAMRTITTGTSSTNQNILNISSNSQLTFGSSSASTEKPNGAMASMEQQQIATPSSGNVTSEVQIESTTTEMSPLLSTSTTTAITNSQSISTKPNVIIKDEKMPCVRCSICSRTFVTRHAYRVHYGLKHVKRNKKSPTVVAESSSTHQQDRAVSQDEPPPFNESTSRATVPSEKYHHCFVCQRIFKSQNSLNAHIDSSHSFTEEEAPSSTSKRNISKDLDLVCLFCGKHFAKPQGLGSHQFHCVGLKSTRRLMRKERKKKKKKKKKKSKTGKLAKRFARKMQWKQSEVVTELKKESPPTEVKMPIVLSNIDGPRSLEQQAGPSNGPPPPPVDNATGANLTSQAPKQGESLPVLHFMKKQEEGEEMTAPPAANGRLLFQQIPFTVEQLFKSSDLNGELMFPEEDEKTNSPPFLLDDIFEWIDGRKTTSDNNVAQLMGSDNNNNSNFELDHHQQSFSFDRVSHISDSGSSIMSSPRIISSASSEPAKENGDNKIQSVQIPDKCEHNKDLDGAAGPSSSSSQ